MYEHAMTLAPALAGILGLWLLAPTDKWMLRTVGAMLLVLVILLVVRMATSSA
jgi:hypothetical protein